MPDCLFRQKKEKYSKPGTLYGTSGSVPSFPAFDSRSAFGETPYTQTIDSA